MFVGRGRPMAGSLTCPGLAEGGVGDSWTRRVAVIPSSRSGSVVTRRERAAITSVWEVKKGLVYDAADK